MGKRKEGRQSKITETLKIHKNREDGRRKELEEGEKSGFFACYLLTSLCPRFKGHTYIGFTVNPRRRIRQHNGEICSGASRTKKKRPWEMVLCIYGFPTNVSALQFEWAWQHPAESLAVREAALGFKSRSGLANKIKLAYTMLTLPSWNNLNLNVNFFSTKYTKHYAGCPSLPNHMRVHIRSMDELPCYTEGKDDIFGFENGFWDDDDDDDDDEKPDRSSGSCYTGAGFKDITMPVYVSADHHCDDGATRVSDSEIHEEQPSCTNDSPVCLISDTPERSFTDHHSVVSPLVEDENGKPECVEESCIDMSMYKAGPGTKIAASSGPIEVIDLFTPSPEHKTTSRKKKIEASVDCPIIDLTQSPIHV